MSKTLTKEQWEDTNTMTDRASIKKIGGSDIAAILGLSRWKSAHSLYLHLIGELLPQEDNNAMERGRKLESVIAHIFAANHEEFWLEKCGIVEDSNYPFLIGSPDRVICDSSCHDVCPGKTVSGLEIKTADISKANEWGDEGTDEIPIEYLIQCQWCAGLLGVPDWHLAVGFAKPGSKKIVAYREYYIESNQERFEAMKQLAIDFWNDHVVPKVAPEVTEADAETVRYYRTKYPQHMPDRWAYSDAEIDRLAAEYMLAAKNLTVSDMQVKTMKIKLIAAIGENEGLKTASGNFTYRTTKPTRRVDWEGAARSLGINETDEVVKNFTTEQPGHRRFLTPKGK